MINQHLPGQAAHGTQIRRPSLIAKSMPTSNLFPGIENFLAIKSPDLIGRIEPDGGFRVLDALSKPLRGKTTSLLQRYQENPHSVEIRSAIIVPTVLSRKWKSASMILSGQVMRSIYPTERGGTTPFVERNRERSIFQGMELLMNFRNMSMPGVPIYCPMLYVHSSKLSDFLDEAQYIDSAVPRECPVVEVLNYIGLMESTERTQDWVNNLNRMIRVIAIQESKRGYGGFSIVTS